MTYKGDSPKDGGGGDGMLRPKSNPGGNSLLTGKKRAIILLGGIPEPAAAKRFAMRTFASFSAASDQSRGR